MVKFHPSLSVRSSTIQLNFDGNQIDEIAIERFKMFEPPEGYRLAFSGGKDSTVIYDLAVRAGVKFSSHFYLSGIDPPQLIQHVRKYYPETELLKAKYSMWQLIAKKGMFPLRVRRFCCEFLKEGRGTARAEIKDGFIVTGVRWAESPRRRMQRKMLEQCGTKSLRMLNPIVDWSDAAVWEYIKSRGIPYCDLYNQGLKRLGCILCPMTSTEQLKHEMAIFPKHAKMWLHAARRLYDDGKLENFNSGDDYFNWWLSQTKKIKEDDPQKFLFQN